MPSALLIMVTGREKKGSQSFNAYREQVEVRTTIKRLRIKRREALLQSEVLQRCKGFDALTQTQPLFPKAWRCQANAYIYRVKYILTKSRSSCWTPQLPENSLSYRADLFSQGSIGQRRTRALLQLKKLMLSLVAMVRGHWFLGCLVAARPMFDSEVSSLFVPERSNQKALHDQI